MQLIARHGAVVTVKHHHIYLPFLPKLAYNRPEPTHKLASTYYGTNYPRLTYAILRNSPLDQKLST